MTSPSDRVAKQVIVMRNDLNMRKGKMVAQGSHASLGAVLMIKDFLDECDAEGSADDSAWYEPFTKWIKGTFTKVCVRVDGETELMRIFGEAQRAKLPVKLITDAGHTEFHGVPTRTCLAIGPAWADEIDKITGGLTLL
jgi:PTH2 family peptidyl-tRNA hydrolase